VGSHSSGWLALGGLIAGLVIGAIIGAAIIATGGGILLLAASVAGALCITAAAGAAGERLGEAYDNDNASGTPCSSISKGWPTVWIENALAARMTDPNSHNNAQIKQGALWVYIGKLPAARHNDKSTCTGIVIPQTKYTYIGGPPADSGAPYQATMAGFLHDFGTALEEEAKIMGIAGLVLGGAAVIGAALGAASLGAGLLAAFEGAVGLGAGYAGAQYGHQFGSWVGKGVDSLVGYTDGRYEHFLGSAGGIAGGFAGGKIAEKGIETGKATVEGFREGYSGRGGPEILDPVPPPQLNAPPPRAPETIDLVQNRDGVWEMPAEGQGRPGEVPGERALPGGEPQRLIEGPPQQRLLEGPPQQRLLEGPGQVRPLEGPAARPPGEEVVPGEGRPGANEPAPAVAERPAILEESFSQTPNANRERFLTDREFADAAIDNYYKTGELPPGLEAQRAYRIDTRPNVEEFAPNPNREWQTGNEFVHVSGRQWTAQEMFPYMRRYNYDPQVHTVGERAVVGEIYRYDLDVVGVRARDMDALNHPDFHSTNYPAFEDVILTPRVPQEGIVRMEKLQATGEVVNVREIPDDHPFWDQGGHKEFPGGADGLRGHDGPESFYNLRVEAAGGKPVPQEGAFIIDAPEVAAPKAGDVVDKACTTCEGAAEAPKASEVVAPEKSLAETKTADFAKDPALQKQVYEQAKGVRERMNALADGIKEKLGLPETTESGRPTAKSLLKRDSEEDFIHGLTEKFARKKYDEIGQMDDMVRGRFNLPDRAAVETAVTELKNSGYEVKEIVPPRVNADGVETYSRYHVVLRDPQTGLTHEWQVGTDSTTKLYEEQGIQLPEALQQAKDAQGKHFNNDLHDIYYDLFKSYNAKDPALGAKYGLPEFIAKVENAAPKAGQGESVDVAGLHQEASQILDAMVKDNGPDALLKFFH
jgi:uncharacterized Zn-binding protein involved in type VI secretion